LDFVFTKNDHTSLLRYTRFRFLMLLSKILSWRSLILVENKPMYQEKTTNMQFHLHVHIPCGHTTTVPNKLNQVVMWNE